MHPARIKPERILLARGEAKEEKFVSLERGIRSVRSVGMIILLRGLCKFCGPLSPQRTAIKAPIIAHFLRTGDIDGSTGSRR